MKLHVTYCSKNKDRTRKDLPAIERYQSQRIEKVKALADEKSEKFAILSGKYGLIGPKKEIPFYDELLREKNIPELLTGVKSFLQTKNVEKVIYYTKKVENERRPYFKLIKIACDATGVEFEKVTIRDS